jgi:ATP-GRASP peptide maturase of grasp-with-spasm system
MVILASRQDDGSTLYVTEWLISLGKKFIRLNTDDEKTVFSHFDSDLTSLNVIQNGRMINLLEASSIWIRRNGFSLKNIILDRSALNEDVFFDKDGYHKAHIKAEFKIMASYLHNLIHNRCKNVLGNYDYGDVNKMNVLERAERIGLKVPQSYIVTTRDQLLDIYSRNSNLLTKALGIGVYLFKEALSYYSYAEKITLQGIMDLPERFFPSLIQVEVKKKFELRVFYLLGDFYSMAIFSQRNDATAVDFRKPNFEKPTRKVPYNLPENVKNLLRQLMNELHLNTGSIDIIVDVNDNYIFLEVNPVGQFSMTSYPCNFYLEKKIAEYL